jgi:hypothetical protein
VKKKIVDPIKKFGERIYSASKINSPFLLALCIGLLLGAACGNGSSPTLADLPKQKLPITERNFFIGLVPNPAHAPNSSFDDILNAYEETGKIAEICMIWVAQQGIGQFILLKQNQVITGVRVYGLKPFLTLNFATIKQGPNGLEYVIDAPDGLTPSLADSGFREAWKNEAQNIAQEFRPEYLSLGNEINDYFYLHPEDLDDYLSLVAETYSAIKQVSPDTKVLVVFAYNHLIENNQWGLFQKFNDKIDLIGLTTYPYQKFTTPDLIPDDYYSKLNQYVTKPIAFTEIGWSSSGTNSEKVQASFLTKFLELTKGLNMEMVNWLFLHETSLSGLPAHISNPEVTTIALKKADGSKKEIYDLWVELKGLK